MFYKDIILTLDKHSANLTTIYKIIMDALFKKIYKKILKYKFIHRLLKNPLIKKIKIFNSNGFKLQSLDTKISPSYDPSLNICFFNVFKKQNPSFISVYKIINFFSKVQKLKNYKNILIIKQNNTLDDKIFNKMKNTKIRFCSTLDDLCRIKYDICFAEIKFDCIFLFCLINEELNFLTHIVQSNEFYNVDLILPSDKTGWHKINRKKFGLPIVSYNFPWAGSHRFFPQLDMFLEKLGWTGGQGLGILRNLKHSKRYFSEKDSKPNIKNTSKVLYGLINTLDYFKFIYSHDWSSLNEVIEDKDYNYIVLMRDPRDIINSYSHYFTFHHQDQYILSDKNLLYQNCSTIEDKLFIILKGHLRYQDWIGESYMLDWPSIDEIMDLYLSVLHLDHINIVRFEDLHQDNTKTMKNLLTNIGLYPSIFYDFTEDFFAKAKKNSSIEHQSKGLIKRGGKNNKWDGCCRKGIIGDWKTNFTPKIVDYIKETTGDKLIKLGYEKNMDWHL